MDFKQLRSFVAVADCGSFTQAAAQLYTSQPTISAHIRQLEEELQQRLFLRIICISSCTKPAAANIYCIRSCIYRCVQTFITSCRRK